MSDNYRRLLTNLRRNNTPEECERLRAENEKLRADKARLDWMGKVRPVVTETAGTWSVHGYHYPDGGGAAPYDFEARSLRKAIDKAMKEVKP